MRISILAVGKLKTRWLSDGVSDYSKRLSRYCRLEIIEILYEKIPKNASSREIEQAKEKEGQHILEKWPKDAYGIALDKQGRTLGSDGLAKLLEHEIAQPGNHAVFVIGGSHGLSETVIQQCRRILSFGPNTFPHQLFRIILLEQLYRAAKIRAGENYHK